MRDTKVLILCGRAQSGKSTAAGLVAARAGYRVMSFADPVKRMLLTLGHELGIEPHHLWGTDAQKNEPLEILNGKSARHAMQTLGTEWRMTIDKDLWVRHLMRRIEATDANRVVVDDMRFEHEYEALRKAGATIVGIESPTQGTTNSTHASEQWDFRTTGMPVIQNNGTLDDLWDKLKAYL